MILNQKGNFLPIIAGILLLTVMAGGTYYFQFQKKSANTQSVNPPPTLPQTSDQSTTNTPPTYPTPEVTTTNPPTNTSSNSFPIYPGATLVKRGTDQPCKPDSISTSICGNTVYTYTSMDNYDQLSSWYQQTQNGWKCSGGTGSYNGPREASGFTTCSNESLKRQLFIEATASKTTFQFGD